MIETRSGETAALRPVDFARAIDVARRLEENIGRVIRGKPNEIRLVLTALSCRGHVLFEDVPGTAKTVLTRALAASIEGAATARDQCTPDLQPSDVTGLSVYNQKNREFEFRAGPVFANVLLVDEINRAMPKTQSALLEAMAEGQVTVDGVTRALPEVFLLFATENPIEHEGTFPLPEAQLDRFFLQLELGYPHADDELRIVQDQRHGHPLRDLRPVVSLRDVEDLQRAVEEVYVDVLIQEWLVALVRATRELEIIELPASVRGSIALDRAARGWALLHERHYVEPEDVEALFGPVVGHRILLAPAFAATARRVGRREAMAQLWRRCLELAPPPERVEAPPH
ncbi:MAG: AAA family ATPase [Actinobacteria bacterium]|nr:AAA family ATPase [Actinomycetota bacterium]